MVVWQTSMIFMISVQIRFTVSIPYDPCLFINISSVILIAQSVCAITLERVVGIMQFIAEVTFRIPDVNGAYIHLNAIC